MDCPAGCLVYENPEKHSSCSILFQRGVYPPESFKQHKQYGLSMMMTTDNGLTSYLTNVLDQMSGKTQ